MPECTACGKQLQPTWMACPYCGASAQRSCAACGGSLEVAWRRCPHCGGWVTQDEDKASAVGPGSSQHAQDRRPVRPAPQALAIPVSAGATSRPVCTTATRGGAVVVAEFAEDDEWPSWRLRACFDRLIHKAMEPFWNAIAAAENLTDSLRSRDPAAVEGATALALDELARGLQFEPLLPPALRTIGADLSLNKPGLLRHLEVPRGSLRAAAEAVVALNLPEGTAAGVLRGFSDVADIGTSASKGAAGGAAAGALVGSIVPGVGTLVGGAIGGAIGAIVGNSQQTKRHESILERYDHAWSRMVDAVQEVFNAAWDLLSASGETCGFELLTSTEMAAVEERWATLQSELLARLSPDTVDQCVSASERFLKEFGPTAAALHLRVRSALPPYEWVPGTEFWSDLSIEIYPNFASSYEDAADVAVAQGNYERALDLAAAVFEQEPDHAGAMLTRVEALAALGRHDAAVDEAALLHDRGHGWAGLLYVARGLVRSGDLPAAEVAIRRWIQETGSRSAVILQAQEDLILRPVFAAGLISRVDGTERLRGIVQQALVSDGEKAFFGWPPGERRNNARSEFLDLRAREVLLFFFDWSVWGNSKTGFAITSERVIWKCLWEDPVKIELRHVSADSVALDGDNLSIGDRKVDMEDEDFAQAAASVLVALGLALR